MHSHPRSELFLHSHVRKETKKPRKKHGHNLEERKEGFGAKNAAKIAWEKKDKKLLATAIDSGALKSGSLAFVRTETRCGSISFAIV